MTSQHIKKRIASAWTHHQKIEEELQYTHTLGKERFSEINKIEDWLRDNYDTITGRWETYYFFGSTKFYFEKKESLIVFKMMWA